VVGEESDAEGHPHRQSRCRAVHRRRAGGGAGVPAAV